MEGERAFAPHCDSSILHAPGACEYCDHYPDWQQMRVTQCINFSGEHDPEKAPCPSTEFLGFYRNWPEVIQPSAIAALSLVLLACARHSQYGWHHGICGCNES